MLTAEQMKVIPLEDLAWPVSYRYHVQLPWGESTQQLTVNAGALDGQLDASLELGRILWQRAIAPAMSVGALLLGYDVAMWRFVAGGLPVPDGFSRGLLAGPAASRENSAVAVLLTGHIDQRGYTRMHLPGIPAAWVSGGQLTLGGRDAVEAWGGMMLMGLLGHLTGSPLQWLVPYKGVLEPSPGNPGGHAFRRVEYVAGMHHTRAAPLPSVAPWP